jgi:hypothetical protein
VSTTLIGGVLVARQPATDQGRSHRDQRPYTVEVGASALPSWGSRVRSLGWITVLVIALGALAAVATAVLVIVAWVLISGAVT